MSVPFHQWGDSRVERMVKVVRNLISAFCKTYPVWDQDLSLLTLAYRTTVNEVTGFTPSFVMTRWEVNLPLDVTLGMANPDNKVMTSEYLNRLQTWLQMCFTEVWKSFKKFGETQRRYYNLSSHGQQCRPGDMVYLQEKTRKNQVSPWPMPKWKGPYMVVQCFRTLYKIMTNFRVTKLYHFDFLKPCNATDIPMWIVRARNHLVPDNTSQRSLKTGKVKWRQVQTGNSQSPWSASPWGMWTPMNTKSEARVC